MKAPVSTLRWRNSACDGRAAAQFGLQPIAAFTRAIQEIGTGSRSRWSIRRELFGAIVDGVGRKANLTTRSHVPARPIHCGGSNRASRHGTHHGKQERKKPLRIIDLQRLHPFDGGVDVLQIMGRSPHERYAFCVWKICVPPKIPPRVLHGSSAFKIAEIGPAAHWLCKTMFAREGRVGQRKLWGIVGLTRRFQRR